MKTLKNLMTLIALVAVTGMTAQKINKQVTQEEMTKTYEINQGDRIIDYTIKINTKETGYVTMKNEDLPKKEQTRVENKKTITKLISIDNDADSSYDNIIAVTYLTKDDANFKIQETDEGFAIIIEGKELRYNFLKKEYNVTKKDTDTFEVVVMKAK